MYNLKGKVAVVTGAGSERGIGHHAAVRLAAEGANVVVADLAQLREGLNTVVSEIEQKGVEGFSAIADVTDERQVVNLVDVAISKFGKIDILINSHGIQGPLSMPVFEYPEEDWNKVMNINLDGTFLCCREVAKHMVERKEGGRIINVASRAGKIGRPGHAAYSASKFAVIGLTQSLALELAPYRITVNAVCPSTLATGFLKRDELEQVKTKFGLTHEEAANRVFSDVIKKIPLGRLCTAQDVVNMILFLASDQADYCTGQAMNVNGGFLMK